MLQQIEKIHFSSIYNWKSRWVSCFGFLLLFRFCQRGKGNSCNGMFPKINGCFVSYLSLTLKYRFFSAVTLFIYLEGFWKRREKEWSSFSEHRNSYEARISDFFNKSWKCWWLLGSCDETIQWFINWVERKKYKSEENRAKWFCCLVFHFSLCYRKNKHKMFMKRFY